MEELSPTKNIATNDIPSSENWEKAVERYISRLKPEQAVAFKAPTNLQDCLDILTKAESRRSRTSRILGLFQPLIDPLKRFEGAIDVLVQTNSGIAAPVWGPIRMALTVAAEHYRTLESLAMILYRILGSIDRYTHYEGLFKSDQRVQDAVGALYADLIDFCSRVVRFHSRKIRSVFYSFDREFGLVADCISYHSSQVDWAANAAHITQVKESRESSENLRQIQDQMIVLRWLSPSTAEDDLDRYSKTCMIGSCDEIFNAPWFKAFVNRPDPESIRLTGRPGSGKTVLSASIVEYLRKSSRTTILYFFCKANDSTKNSTIHVLRTLLAQLIQSEDNLYKLALRDMHQDGREEAVSLTVISRTFHLAFSYSSSPQTFIVIDALDECQDPKDLVTSLRQCTLGAARVLVTSRSSPGLDPLFDGMVSMDSFTNNAKAIEAYIYQRTQDLKHLQGTELGRKVTLEVCQASHGLWLFAKLMMDEISYAPSIASISTKLRKVPHGLAQLYDSILESIGSRCTEEQILLVQQALLWLDPSDYMNPSLSSNDDLLRSESLKLALQFANKGDPVFDDIELIRELCAPLVEVRSGPWGPELESVHFSVQQHLAHSSDRKEFETPKLLKPRRLRELHRAAAATWYFTSCDDFELHLKHLASFALEEREMAACFSFTGGAFEMAYGLWNAFTIEDLPTDLTESEMAEASRLLSELTDFLTSSKCLRWVERSIIQDFAGIWTTVAIENAQRVLHAAHKQPRMPALEALQIFKKTCQERFAMYIEIMVYTAPESLCVFEHPLGFGESSVSADEIGITAAHKHDQVFGGRNLRCFSSDEHQQGIAEAGPLHETYYESEREKPMEMSDRWNGRISTGTIGQHDTNFDPHFLLTSPSSECSQNLFYSSARQESLIRLLADQPRGSVYRSMYSIAWHWSRVLQIDPVSNSQATSDAVINTRRNMTSGYGSDGSTSSEDLLESHLQNLHLQNVADSGQTSPDPRPWIQNSVKCEYCGVMPDRSISLYVCWRCPTKACSIEARKFKSEQELERHISRSHPELRYRRYHFGPICNKCSVRSQMRRNLVDGVDAMRLRHDQQIKSSN